MSADDRSLLDALIEVHEVLDEAAIDHALCGGLAGNLYRTVFRTTDDVDLYITCAAPKILDLARRFEGHGWTVHPAWRKAQLVRLERRDRPRIDLLVAATSYERQAIERAVLKSFDEIEMRVLTPEDLIVFKLVAGRFHDYETVAAIINTQGSKLDASFIQRKLAQFGMSDRWDMAVEGAEREGQDLG